MAQSTLAIKRERHLVSQSSAHSPDGAPCIFLGDFPVVVPLPGFDITATCQRLVNMGTKMEKKADLEEKFQLLFLEGLQQCKDDRKGQENVFQTYKKHTRSPQIRQEMQELQAKRKKLRFIVKFILFPVLCAAIVTPFCAPEQFNNILESIQSTECLVENNYFLTEMARPLFQCDICKDMTEIDVVQNLRPADFVAKYAYSSIPVLVKGATKDWTALNTFSFEFFKDLYGKARAMKSKPDDEEEREPACQFFPYKTEFDTLTQAMNMSDDRASYKPGEKPWYFGWSNCDDFVHQELRKHYSKPYFLPSDSETVFIDWIFMGGNGKGAPLHLDTVDRPSWQAQISGTKTWTVAPVPECEHVCHTMNVTVHQGDIIVIDTNQWYHGTYVHPGPLSITIGSEFD